MLIENVIRLGKPLLKGGLTPREVLEQVSDVLEEGKNFFQNVILVELDETRFAVHPVSRWGEFRELPAGKNKTRSEFFPDKKVLGANFVVPRAGNPLKAQGWYGIASYPIYTKTLLQFSGKTEAGEELEDQQESIASIAAFIKERKRKTSSLNLTDELIDEISKEISKKTRELEFEKKERPYGLLLIAQLKDSPFQIADKPVMLGDSYFSNVGGSLLYPGRYIVADLAKVLDSFWPAKIAEGAEKGRIETGQCFVCKQNDELVSAYCKSWPWFLHTWDCPNPLSWGKNEMTNGIALCQDCYKALSYGATVLTKITTELDYHLTKEIFTPVSNAKGKEDAKKGQAKARIYGSAYALPILDLEFNQEEREYFVEGFQLMLSNKTRENRLDTHLKAIAGFEYILPAEFSKDDYRLNITYFSGDPNRGDIHVRAIIEDVVPSTAIKLEKISRAVQQYAIDVAQNMMELSEDNRNRILRIYGSLPYLLVNAFGSPYLWTTLDSIMHNARISTGRFVKNSSVRMNQLAHSWPNSLSSLRDEVLFYLSFKYFLKLYQEQVAIEKEGMEAVKDWQELRTMIREMPPENIVFADVEEIGFGAGVLTRIFAAQYYNVAGRDFLKHRVMTFGSDLTPRVIWKRALIKMREYATRLDMRVTNDFWQRLSMVLLAFEDKSVDIEKSRDSFMAMFWSGYNLALPPQEQESAEAAEIFEESEVS